jgi:hypothetical protein
MSGPLALSRLRRGRLIYPLCAKEAEASLALYGGRPRFMAAFARIRYAVLNNGDSL